MYYSLSSVAGTPTELTATEVNTNGLDHVQLSWSSVSGVVGYEVFYQVNSSSTVVSVANTTNTTLNIASGLSSGKALDFFVVSYGDGTILPSNRSVINSSVSDLTVTTTSTTVTLTLSLPDIVPQSYYANHTCHRLCEQHGNKKDVTFHITFPYHFNDINPGSVCIFLLYGVYGSKQILLVTISASTLSTGNIQYLIQSFSIFIYSSYFICQ